MFSVTCGASILVTDKMQNSMKYKCRNYLFMGEGSDRDRLLLFCSGGEPEGLSQLFLLSYAQTGCQVRVDETRDLSKRGTSRRRVYFPAVSRDSLILRAIPSRSDSNSRGRIVIVTESVTN